MKKQNNNQMPKGWKETTLGEVAEITSAKRIFANEYKSAGIPFFRGKEITEKFNGNEISTELYISEGKYEEIKNKYGIPEENDILLTSVGTLGNPYLVEKDFNFYFKDGNLTWFRKFNNIIPKYLFYWIISPQGKETLSHAKIGSTQEAYTIVKLKELSLAIPPLPEQRAITVVLSSFDDKIEILREENKTLETIAQTLFKRWFVEFEFPNEKGKPYKSSGGKMIDSELGEIPEGWRVSTVEQVTSVVTKGTTPTTVGGSFSNNGINFIKVESITDDHDFDSSKIGCISDDTNRLLSRSIINEGDLLFTIAGTIGRFVVATKSILPANTNQAVAIIRANTSIIDPYYLRCYFELSSIKSFLFGGIVEAVQANLSLTNIKNSKIVVPDERGRSIFCESIKILFNRVDANRLQIQTLSTLRDSLLSKLMRGEVRVG